MTAPPRNNLKTKMKCLKLTAVEKIGHRVVAGAPEPLHLKKLL